MDVIAGDHMKVLPRLGVNPYNYIKHTSKVRGHNYLGKRKFHTAIKAGEPSSNSSKGKTTPV